MFLGVTEFQEVQSRDMHINSNVFFIQELIIHEDLCLLLHGEMRMKSFLEFLEESWFCIFFHTAVYSLYELESIKVKTLL